MVIKYERGHHRENPTKNNVKADVIILGCNLPGIVAAHKLKKKFGDAMDIVVLDIAKDVRHEIKYNVAFRLDHDNESDPSINNSNGSSFKSIGRHYITKYATELNIPLPIAILAPETIKSPLNKLFQFGNGSTVNCKNNYHDFSYLSFVERFELNQYQSLLDESMRELFLFNHNLAETKKLLYYDRTMMEKHICDALLFPTSREVMRLVVRLVCGSPANTVSVLFYLHQCYRTNGCKNHIDGANTMIREKLLGYCRQRMKCILQQSIEDITLVAKPIRTIRKYSDERVVLETMKGETNYICNLLAMALGPDELRDIVLDENLTMQTEGFAIISSMSQGFAKKVMIHYNDNFWRSNGYSGDIFSISGPIIWATERPKLSSTGSEEKYSTLIGFLKIGSKRSENYKEAVLNQLVHLFGEEASEPAHYKESEIADVFIPRIGHYITLQNTPLESGNGLLEWGALDIFAEGDLASALEAGHSTYLQLLHYLRPQAESYDDIITVQHPNMLEHMPVWRWLALVNYFSSLRLLLCSVGVFVGVKILKSYFRKV